MPRNPTVIDKIPDAKDFKTALDTLCLDLSDASDHYKLFRNLIAAKEGEYAKAVSQSQTFWSLVYGANLDATVFRLCRVYDQEKGALTLRTLLETIKARPDYLPKPSPQLDEAKLDAALKWAHKDSNPVVKNLMIWRHKVYAHRDVEKALVGGLAEAYPVTHDDIQALLDQGFDIVNGYNAVFFRSSFARDVAGLNDYVKVLRTLQSDVERMKADFQEQVKRAREGA
jgi:AbiU2